MGSKGTQNRAVTLAILPFENLSQGNDLDILCQSFSIDLTTELSRFKQFQIVAPDSIDQIKNNEEEQANALGLDIDYHIKGSFRAHRDSMRINAQLLSTRSRHLVWADRFEGTTEQILDIQDDLLKQVVSSLQQQLNYDLLSQIREKPKIKLKAYECWLYGMNEVKKGSVENDRKAREYFQQAIQEEPHFSLAYSGMSLTYFNEWSCQMWERWDVSQAEAFEWANRAIEFDERNYVAALVLGRILMYKGSYETAEHYVRKSLMLNPNDADNLIEIASCLTFMGFAENAWELYQRADSLNPAGRESYYPTAAFILFEIGDFEKAKEFAQKTTYLPWVDTPAYFAATYYHIGELEQSEKCWQQFLESYSQKINHGLPAYAAEAIEWMIRVNPHKGSTNMEPYWKYKLEAKTVDELLKTPAVESRPNARNSFHKQDDFWRLSYEGTEVQLTEVKGYHDLKKLLDNPGQPIHCAELMGITITAGKQYIIDEKARAEYQKRIKNLQQEIAQADQDNDLVVLSQLQQEYDQLLEHLSSSLGLSGKIRQAGNPIEKARSAVTWRIRNAISKIEKAHPLLGKHLSHAINTGTFCSYDPEKQVEWVL
jgi:TolB-like protein/Tfp pilus assembly protein PilF/predicted transcriptional regulator